MNVWSRSGTFRKVSELSTKKKRYEWTEWSEWIKNKNDWHKSIFRTLPIKKANKNLDLIKLIYLS